MGGEGVRAAGETGQGRLFSYLAFLTRVRRAAPAPLQPGRRGRLCSNAEIAAAAGWGQPGLSVLLAVNYSPAGTPFSMECHMPLPAV